MESITNDGKFGKNRLQEYFQRIKVVRDSDGNVELPTYTHQRTENGLWRTVLILPGGCHPKFFAEMSTKKAADQEAAEMALKWLKAKETPTRWYLPGCCLVLINLGSHPMDALPEKEWNSVQWDCSKVEAFSSNSSVYGYTVEKLESLFPYVDRFHDVAGDIQWSMACRIGQWLESFKHPDHYLDGEEGCLYEDTLFIVDGYLDKSYLNQPTLTNIDRQLEQLHLRVKPKVVICDTIEECFGMIMQNAKSLLIQ